MRPVLAFRHNPHEPLGLMEGVLTQAHLPFSYIDLFDEIPRIFDPRFISGLVVLGGPMNVNEVDKHRFLLYEPDFIKRAIAHNVPVLGLCLGAQLISKALGGVVYPAGRKEMGWHRVRLTVAAEDDLLFHDAPREFEVFQWHQDTFTLPEQAVHLVRSPQVENQAFRYGATTYGVQFHLEATQPIIEDWTKDPSCWMGETSCVDGSQDSTVSPEKILKDTQRHLSSYHELGRRLLGRFTNLCHERSG